MLSKGTMAGESEATKVSVKMIRDSHCQLLKHAIFVSCWLSLVLFLSGGGAPLNANAKPTTSKLRPLPGVTFPPLRSENLSKKKVSLPGDFKGALNLVFVAFWRRQQREVDTWLAYRTAWQKRYPALRFYELPTIRKGMRFFRFFIDGGMRSGIQDKAARARTITLYIDKKPFRKSLGLPHEKTIYALLLDGKGRVYWKAAGTATKANRASLQKKLQQFFRR